MKKRLLLCLFLAGCSMQDINDAKKLDVDGKTYYVGSASNTASCTEVNVVYLFDTEKKLIDVSRHGGQTIPCAALAGAVAGAAIGAGIGVQRPAHISESETLSNSQAQSQEQYQKQNQSQHQSVNNPALPPHGYGH